MLKVGVWGPGSMGVIALRGVIDHPELIGRRRRAQRCQSRPRCGRAVRDRAGGCGGHAGPGRRCSPATPTWWCTRPAPTCGRWRPSRTWCRSCGPARTWCRVRWCRWCSPSRSNARRSPSPLRQAALDGGVSFFTTGIDSGFANDVLPLVLTGVSRVIESVRVTEMFNYATYPDKAAVYEILGFGKPPEFTAFAATPGVFTFGWGPVLHQLAAGLGTSRSTTSRRATNGSPPPSRSTPPPVTSRPGPSRRCARR